MCDVLHNRENLIISLHPHNDRGCAVADCEMGLLAGADRIEGTCFGNGERTGNADIVTIAMNMYTHGVDPKLDFSDLPSLVELYERVTRMKVYERTPYSGALVFAAFSGSHQDAIAKGMNWRKENDLVRWTCPYLPIDPKDVGREYEGDVIRINSQSGKGGIGYIMETRFGIDMPPKMRESFGYVVKGVSDHAHKELMPDEIRDIFFNTYVNREDKIKVKEAHFVQGDGITSKVTIEYKGDTITAEGKGNGRLDAVSNAVKDALGFEYSLITYKEHALEVTSKSKAMCYVGIQTKKGVFWGAGIHTDIIDASVSALMSAVNNSDLVD